MVRKVGGKDLCELLGMWAERVKRPQQVVFCRTGMILGYWIWRRENKHLMLIYLLSWSSCFSGRLVWFPTCWSLELGQ